VFDVPSWVNDLAWNDEGTALAVACHNSTVVIFTGASPTDFTTWGSQTVTLALLPLRSLVFVSENAIVGGGHDYYPVGFAINPETGLWALSATGSSTKGKKEEKLSETQLARQRFQNQSALGTTESVELPVTRHSNTILTVLKAGKNKFATASADGRIEYWDMAALEPIA
jgi:actin related protein 2/3 complex subunit 1A/1B